MYSGKPHVDTVGFRLTGRAASRLVGAQGAEQEFAHGAWHPVAEKPGGDAR